MSIRLRISLALLITSLAPIILAVLWTTNVLQQAANVAIEDGLTAVEESGQAAIRAKAESVAAQIQIYLQENPQISPYNNAQLEADPTLKKIAVQLVGRTGYTAVHNEKGISIFHTNPVVVNTNLLDLKESLPEFWNILDISLDGTPAQGYYNWIEPDGSVSQKYMAVVSVPGTPLRVAATTYIQEFSQPIVEIQTKLEDSIQTTRNQFGALAAILGSVILIAAILLGTQITAPLRRMIKATERLAKGELDAIQPLQAKTETGLLGQWLFEISQQLHQAAENLEGQVRERTGELTRRSAQLEAVTFVGREVTRARDLKTMLTEAADLIRDRFGFYHAGIYLMDEMEEYAVLAAGTGEAGRQMMENNQRFRIGESGIIGSVAATGNGRIALDSGKEAVTFKNPLLPETHSQMVLPLNVGGKTIGAIDIQAVETAAFEEEDAAILQTLADQLAVAITNIRLVERSEAAYKEIAAVYESNMRQSWQPQTEREHYAFEYNRLQVIPIDKRIPENVRKRLESGQATFSSADEIDKSSERRSSILLTPIVLHGLVVGVIGIENDNPDYHWRGEEISTAEAIAGQVAIALENARLLEESLQRASQEQAISDITAKVSSSVEIETILRTTAQELSRILQGSEVLIQLENKTGKQTRL